MIDRKHLKWTKEDDEAVKQYKKDIRSGKITAIPLDKAMEMMRPNQTLKDKVKFQIGKHHGKLGYEYVTKILRELLDYKDAASAEADLVDNLQKEIRTLKRKLKDEISIDDFRGSPMYIKIKKILDGTDDKKT